MSDLDDAQARAQLVEDLAHAFEPFGLSRTAGRILGRLLVSDQEYESLDSLAEALDASKGSMSTMARQLMVAGLIERVAVPGQRRDFYRVRPGGWAELNRDRVEALSQLAGVAGRNSALAALREFCQLAAQDLAKLPNRCQDQREGAKSGRTGGG